MQRSDPRAPQLIASTHGVEIALHDFGGVGSPVLICHATGMNAPAYRPMATRLASEFDVWALDLRAHGASTAPADGDFGWSNMADDILAVIDHLGLESVQAVGHSMGGASILLAERKRPGVISAAWLYEPILIPPDVIPTRNSTLAEGARERRSEFASKDAALMRYASRPPLGILRADALAGYVQGGFVETERGTVQLACDPEHEASTFDNAMTGSFDLASIETRTIIASGAIPDEPGAAAFAPPAAAALPNGWYVQYPQLGHFGPLQDPDLIAAEAAAFFRG